GYSADKATNTDAGAGPSATFDVISTDANLVSMNPQYGPMTPAFRPLHFSYTLAVPNAVKTFWIAPVTDNPNATMTVNGIAVRSGTQSTPVALAEGAATTITVVVTAEDGTTTQTYNI